MEGNGGGFPAQDDIRRCKQGGRQRRRWGRGATLGGVAFLAGLTDILLRYGLGRFDGVATVFDDVFSFDQTLRHRRGHIIDAHAATLRHADIGER